MTKEKPYGACEPIVLLFQFTWRKRTFCTGGLYGSRVERWELSTKFLDGREEIIALCHRDDLDHSHSSWVLYCRLCQHVKGREPQGFFLGTWFNENDAIEDLTEHIRKHHGVTGHELISKK